MRVYWLVAILTFIIQFVRVKDEKQYWWRTVISFIPLFLFLALRKDYGVDEGAYHDFFIRIQHATNIFKADDHMEMGYAILNKVMPSYQCLIFFVSFINCWALSYLIYQYVPRKCSWLAILLIFLTPSLTIFFMISGIRNGLAASILILATYFLVGEKKRLLPYLLLGIVATSIHTSAMVMFAVCYFLSSSKPISNRGMIIWIVALLLASFSSLSSLADIVMPLIEFFMGRYTSQVESIAEVADERGLIAAMAGIVLAIGVLLFTRESNKLIEAENGGFAKYKWALFYCFSYTLGMLGGRMAQYLVYYFIVVTVCMFAYWKKPLYRYGYLLMVVYFYWNIFNDWLGNPYFSYSIYKSVLGDF